MAICHRYLLRTNVFGLCSWQRRQLKPVLLTTFPSFKAPTHKPNHYTILKETHDRLRSIYEACQNGHRVGFNLVDTPFHSASSLPACNMQCLLTAFLMAQIIPSLERALSYVYIVEGGDAMTQCPNNKKSDNTIYCLLSMEYKYSHNSRSH